MGVRFNKRIKVLPWVTANVGKSGISLTIGPKGKTLNIWATGVNVNVSLGKGMGYSKRLITWKKLSLPAWLGMGSTAAAKATKGAKGKAKKDATPKDTESISLDDALKEVNGTTTTDAAATEDTAATTQQEQAGCGPVGCAVGIVAAIVIVGLIAAVVYLFLQLHPDMLPGT